MNEAYEKQLVLDFEKEIKRFTATCDTKKLSVEHSISVVLTSLSFVLCSTLVSFAKAAKLDQEKFNLLTNEVSNKLKKFANDLYEGNDEINS